jgi:type VI protein secretion system component VasK
MKATFALIGAATLLAAAALAQSDVIIKQHAKEIRDQNNVRQGVTPPAPPPPAARPTPTTAAPNPVQQSLAKVRADLTAIQPGSQVTAQQKQQLAKDLLATAQGANKPSSATVTALAEELSTACAQKSLADKDLTRLLTDLAAVLNPANIQQTQMQAIFSDVQAIFQVSGLARKDAIKISDAAKAVAAEARH